MEPPGVKDECTGKPSSGRKRKMPVPEIGGALTIGCQEGYSPSASGDQLVNVASREPPPSRKRLRPSEDWLIHPPDGSEPIDLKKEAEAILTAFEDSLCRDVVFELHREMHTGIVTNERLWAEKLHPPPKPKSGGDVYGRIPPKEPSSNITCPSCGRAVGASRFAPHLDKCVLGPSRVRSSRSARSSPTPPEQSKSIGKPLPAMKPAAAKPAAKKPSTSNPPKTTSTKPSPRAASRPSAKPAAAKLSPAAPGASPPPPPPAVHPPVLDKEREPLHILIKLVDGSPVQTYHRVVLTAPRTSKPPRSKSPPSRRGDAGSDRAYARDDSHFQASAFPVGRTVNHKQIRGSLSAAELCQGNGLVGARGASAGREIEDSGRGSSRDRGGAGARGMSVGLQQQSHGRGVRHSTSGSGGSGRSSSVSRASSPVATRVPPPMIIPASRGSPPPSRQSGVPGSKQKSSSSGGNGGCSSSSRYTVMT